MSETNTSGRIVGAAPASASFVDAEALILPGYEAETVPSWAALRKVGDLIRVAEKEATHEG